MQETRQIGREEGLEEGRAEEKMSTLQNMIKSNFKLEQMSAVLALPEEEVTRMIEALDHK